jgi:hypothetical protein
MRKLIAVILTLFTVAFFAGCLELATAAPMAAPEPKMATQAEMEAGTETKARTLSPLLVAQAISALAAEGVSGIVDADIAAAGNNDTTHTYSKDDIHDYLIQLDTDLDGDYTDETWYAAVVTAAEIGAAYDTEAELNALFAAVLTEAEIGAAYDTEAELDALFAAKLTTATLGAAYDTEAELDALFAAKLNAADIGAAYDTAAELDALFSGKEDADAAITKTDEAETLSANWVNTANPWADNEVADDLTISSSGSVSGLAVDINGTTNENTPATDDKVLIYDASATANRSMTYGNFKATIGAGDPITVDLEDDGGNETEALSEIAPSNDTNSVFAVSGTKLTVDLSNNWPTADTATVATTITVTDNESTDEANAVLFTSGGDVDGGDIGIESDGNLTYNPSSGTLAVTEFSGGGSGLTGITASQITDQNAGTDVTADLEEEVTEGSLADSVIVSADIKDGEVGADDLAATLDISGKTVTFGLETTDIPDLSATYEAVDAEILRADTNDTITADYTHSGTSTFNGEVTMGADFNLNANEIQSTGNVVFQLGDNAGSNVLEVEDSDGTAVWWLDSDGGTHTVATNNPAVSLNENDGTDYWFGINDTTTDRVELRRSAAVNTNVDAYWDSDGAYVAGNMNIATGHTYQINGTQINIGNLGAGGNWTPTGSINLDSSTLTLNSDALTVDNGSNYTTVSNSSDDDTIDEILASIDSWASGVSAGTLVTLSDVGGDDVYTAGYLIIGDGSDSYDPKAISGDVTLAADGAVTIAANAVENSMMADNAVDTAELAADAVEGTKIADDQIDSEHYVAGSIDNEHLADDAVDSDEIAAGAIDLAHMSAESVDSDQYVDGSIDNAHLADDAVDSDEIASGAIDLAHMSAESVDSDQYVDGSIDNAHLADDAVDSDEIADGAVDNVHLSDDAALAAYIAGDPDSLDDTLSTNPKLYRNGYIFYNAAGEATLDAFSTAGEGVSIEFVPSAAVIVNPNAAQTITLNGTALAQGEALINDSNWGLCVLVYAGSNSIRAACTSDIVQEVE